jgi:excisionase family DNA binding protein
VLRATQYLAATSASDTPLRRSATASARSCAVECPRSETAFAGTATSGGQRATASTSQRSAIDMPTFCAITFNAAPHRLASGTEASEASASTTRFYIIPPYTCDRVWYALAYMRDQARHFDGWGGAVPGALSIREAGHALGLSPQTVRRRVLDGELRSFRLGGSVRIPTSEIARVRGEEVPA